MAFWLANGHDLSKIFKQTLENPELLEIKKMADAQMSLVTTYNPATKFLTNQSVTDSRVEYEKDPKKILIQNKDNISLTKVTDDNFQKINIISKDHKYKKLSKENFNKSREVIMREIFNLFTDIFRLDTD